MKRQVLIFVKNKKNKEFQNSICCYLYYFRIVYNRSIVYKRYDFIKVVVLAIIIDQCNQSAR